MILEKLELRNYRGFKPEPILFERDVTVLVGPNDTGKSNVLRALSGYRDPKALQPDEVATKGNTAGPQVLTTWFVPDGWGRRKQMKQFTKSNDESERVALRVTSEGVSCWLPAAQGQEQAKTLGTRGADRWFPGASMLDMAAASQLPTIPGSLAPLDELKSDDNRLVAKLLQVGGCDISQLLASETEAGQRRSVRTVAAKVNEKLQLLLPSAPSLTMHIQNGLLDISFSDEEQYHFSTSQRGYGLLVLLRAIVLVLSFVEHDKKKPRSLILLDEPETGLHPGAQQGLCEFLQGVAREHKHQVIYATHSPFMIDPNRIHQVRLVGKDGTACVVENKPYQLLHKEPIRSALQLPMGYGLFLSDKNTIVEGISDQAMLVALSQACAALDLPYLDLRNTSIIPAGGAGENLFGALKARATRRGAQAIAVYDKDEAGHKALGQAKEADCNGLYVNAQPYSGTEITTTEFTTEDLVPARIYLEALKHDYAKVHAKQELRDTAPTPDEMADMLDKEQSTAPILAACEGFVQTSLAGAGFEFRKNAVATEAASLLLEGMPSERAGEQGTYGKQDLERAQRLFAEINRLFDEAKVNS